MSRYSVFSLLLSVSLMIAFTVPANAATLKPVDRKFVTADVGMVLSNGEMNIDFRNEDQSEDILLSKDMDYTLMVTNRSNSSACELIGYAVYNKQDPEKPFIGGVLYAGGTMKEIIHIKNSGMYYITLSSMATTPRCSPPDGSAMLGTFE